MYQKDLGKQGEQFVERYLVEKGYIILDHNYFKRSGEIDLIAEDPTLNEIVFVEVKTRTTKTYGRPEEAVGPSKINKMVTTARQWLHENKKLDRPWRIDIMALEIEGNETKITHLENVTL